jgi:hypothetical protein
MDRSTHHETIDDRRGTTLEEIRALAIGTVASAAKNVLRASAYRTASRTSGIVRIREPLLECLEGIKSFLTAPRLLQRPCTTEARAPAHLGLLAHQAVYRSVELLHGRLKFVP